MNGFFRRQQFSNDKQTQADIRKIKNASNIHSFILSRKMGIIKKKNPNYKKETLIHSKSQ